MKYHINPYTGVPNACYAKPGNCPYGDDEDHFGSYEEAAATADAIMEEQYPIFNSDDIDTNFPINDDSDLNLYNDYEKTLNIEEEYEYLDNLEDEEVVDLLTTTDDENLLDAVISRRILVEEDNEDNKYIYAVAKNQFLPKEIKEDVIKNPDSYAAKFTGHIIKYQNLNEKQLFSIAEKSKNEAIQKLALKQPSISTKSILLNIGDEKYKTAGRLALYLGYNPNTPKDVAVNARVRLKQLIDEQHKGR